METKNIFCHKYQDYSLQSRLHFRIHAAQHKLRAGAGEGGNNNNSKEAEQEAVLMNLAGADKGNMLRDLETCSEAQLREMVPHI